MAIADLGFAQALLTGERRLLELVATGEPLPVVLDALCTIAEATGSGLHCSILLVDRHARASSTSRSADRAINPDLERFYAKRANAKTTELMSSHGAFLSRPRDVVKVIEEAAQ
jgi:hypothetical protein